EDVRGENDLRFAPAMGETIDRRVGAPQVAVVRCGEQVRVAIVTDDPEVDPVFEVRGRAFEERGRLAPLPPVADRRVRREGGDEGRAGAPMESTGYEGIGRSGGLAVRDGGGSEEAQGKDRQEKRPHAASDYLNQFHGGDLRGVKVDAAFE